MIVINNRKRLYSDLLMARFATLFRITPMKSGVLIILISSMIWYSFGYEKPVIISALDNRLFDFMFQSRGTTETSGKVQIVDIDEKSLKVFGQWPWPRDVVARLVDRIVDAGARVVGFDAVFAEKDRTSPSMILKKYKHMLISSQNTPDSQSIPDLPDHDLILADSLARGSIVSGYVFLFKDDSFKNEQDVPFPSVMIKFSPKVSSLSDVSFIKAYRSVLNVPELSTALSEGFFNVIPDPSGTIRKVPFFIAMNSVPYPSLALEMVRVAGESQEYIIHVADTGIKNKKTVLGVTLNHTFVPTDARGQMTINYRGPVYTFDYLSAGDVLNGNHLDRLKDKYVLVGSSASGIMDIVATPFSPMFPGVEIHATVIDNIIKNDPMLHENYTEIGFTYVAILVCGMLMVASLVYLKPLRGSAMALVTITAVVLFDYFFFFLKGQLVGISFVFITLVIIFISVTVMNYFYEGKKRDFIRNAFSHYVSPSIVSQLIRKPEKLMLTVEKKYVTIFFSDIRDFTTISEKLSPEKLGVLLNEYLTVISNVILEHHGMVDKYIGDAVMAVWGTPLEDSQHAENAVRASLAISQALKDRKEAWERIGATIETGIGVNTGYVSAGNFGSSKRFEYTVLGDHVNLASRLEGLNKIYGADIIISEFTMAHIENKFTCRHIDTVRVKGKTKSVKIFVPLIEGEPNDDILIYNNEFYCATSLYRSGKFQEALNLFKELSRRRKDSVVDVYIERTEAYLTKPPPASWDGIYDLN